MFVTRRAEFSASHVCRLDSLSEAENEELFGPAANPHGHGHNYIVEVTLEGEPDPVTGMVIDLKDLKQLLNEEILAPMDHRFLNHEVEPFGTVIPTAENIAREIWRRLEDRVSNLNASLAKVRLFETPDLYVEVAREDGAA
ncbi:MAG: 6-pyruvoyl trahydropterin synthase family protein [Bryobacteraceae bacterium]|jgi:6-pyruvoyltetrahydropterin/6-carboxytetrahydropterin synthase